MVLKLWTKTYTYEQIKTLIGMTKLALQKQLEDGISQVFDFFLHLDGPYEVACLMKILVDAYFLA